MKQTRKTNLLKRARCRCNGKVIMMNLPISKYFIFWPIVRTGQQYAKCDQSAALNKNSGDFITLSVFL